MAQHLPPRPGGYQPFEPRLREFLDLHGEKLAPGLRNQEELRALGQGMDQILTGEFLRAGDTLVQRFKAVTAASREGWESAKSHQLTPEQGVGLIPEEERRWAAQEATIRTRTQRILQPTAKAHAAPAE